MKWSTLLPFLQATRFQFPTERDKGIEVPSLSQDKGTTGRAGTACQDLRRDMDGVVQDFDNLSRTVGQNRTKQKRMF